MVTYMKEIGKLTKERGKAHSLGKVVINMKVNLKMVIEKEKVPTFIQMVINMKDIGLKVKGKAKEHLLGKMEINMKAIGKIM